jgi:hypothetical protein
MGAAYWEKSAEEERVSMMEEVEEQMERGWKSTSRRE